MSATALGLDGAEATDRHMRQPAILHECWPLRCVRGTHMVTASGRPSGMATTMMVTAMMKALMTPLTMTVRGGFW